MCFADERFSSRTEVHLTMRTVLIVQARMSSTRLPCKVMKILQGKTYLEHCLDRCRLVSGIDEVICATTDESDCDSIVHLCRVRGYRWYRGSLTNVLDRYHGAAQDAKADAIMRITSDCPLVEPDLAGQVAAKFKEGNHDLVTTNIPPSWPLGLDVEMFSMESLREAVNEALLAQEREHVSTFIRTRPIRYRMFSLPCPLQGIAHWRLTLDTEHDKRFFEAMADAANLPLADTRLADIVVLLRQHPGLIKLNSLI